MLEDLNTVHALKKEIERLREGEEGGHTPEVKMTAGQLWMRLLDMRPPRRIEMLRSLLQDADEGAKCAREAHEDDLEYRYQQVLKLSRELRQWSTARKLITIFLGTLRDKSGQVDRAVVADRLEKFLATGIGVMPNRIVCGYRWTESGQAFDCAEPVSPDGEHEGDHAAYVRKGFDADRDLHVRYLEEENTELRRRLGLPPNPVRR